MSKKLTFDLLRINIIYFLITNPFVYTFVVVKYNYFMKCNMLWLKIGIQASKMSQAAMFLSHCGAKLAC